MNNLANIKRTMTSREIAEYTGKRHSDVMEAIRTMEPAWEKVNGRKFPLVEYKDAKGEMRPEYQLSKTECLYVATKFNDEARARLILRWEELEQESKHRLPQSFSEALMLAAQQAQELEQKELQLQAQAPKVRFAEAVETSTRSCLVAELAKIITQNGYEIGQNRLFKWLRINGYLGRYGDYYNFPTQRAMEMGLFEVKKTSISKPDGTVLVNNTPKVTGKGQVYFVNKLLKGQEG
ncbi:MAG TPA: phage regulatory protein/antirepressor Ant [Anaerolineaceae bacterium]|nr:phage regulatory protein/antirepressor Ant [Anaerolineaceae bacterium]